MLPDATPNVSLFKNRIRNKIWYADSRKWDFRTSCPFQVCWVSLLRRCVSQALLNGDLAREDDHSLDQER